MDAVVERVRGRLDGRDEAEGEVRGAQIIVDRLGYAQHGNPVGIHQPKPIAWVPAPPMTIRPSRPSSLIAAARSAERSTMLPSSSGYRRSARLVVQHGPALGEQVDSFEASVSQPPRGFE